MVPSSVERVPGCLVVIAVFVEMSIENQVLSGVMGILYVLHKRTLY